MQTMNDTSSYPCPWCGYYDLLVQEKGMENIVHPAGECFVMCDHCGATGPKAKTKDEAIKKWNECVDTACEIPDADDLTAEEMRNITEEETDNINHPAHYCMGKIETVEAISAALGDEGFQSYCAGNVLKYVWRYRHKGGKESLEKARWYLDRLIAEVGKGCG